MHTRTCWVEESYPKFKERYTNCPRSARPSQGQCYNFKKIKEIMENHGNKEDLFLNLRTFSKFRVHIFLLIIQIKDVCKYFLEIITIKEGGTEVPPF
jgi:hypothetical protein